MAKKLSVVISAYNEESRIGDCLSSVRFADEIILVNSGSTDKTAEIARKYTDKIFNRSNNPMLNVNKNFGFSKARCEWILSLDADERVEKDLKEEIQELLRKDNSDISAYKIPRKNIIFKKWIQHTGWYPDYQIRLFRKGKGKFEEKHVHELVTVDGAVGVLKGHLLHLNYESVSQFVQKLDRYTESEKLALLEKEYTVKALDAIKFPKDEFIHRYFIRKGYKDGIHGLVLSLLMAFYYLVVFAKLWEDSGYNKMPVRMSETKQKVKKTTDEVMFWFDKTEGKITLRRIKRKIARMLGLL